MAQRRLFSTKVTSSDAFFALSHQAQALYYQLCMSADDDGFTGNAVSVIRSMRLNKKRLDELEKSGYIIVFDNGVVVIRHWHINNTIPKSRYVPTVFAAEIKKVFINDCGIYEKVESSSSGVSRDCGSESATHSEETMCREIENQSSESAEVSAQHNLTEHNGTQLNGREENGTQVMASQENETQNNESEDEDDSLTHFYMGRYANVYLSSAEIQSLKRDVPGYADYIERLSEYMEQSGKQYKSHDAVIRRWYRADKEKKSTSHPGSTAPLSIKPSYNLDAFTSGALSRKLDYKGNTDVTAT